MDISTLQKSQNHIVPDLVDKVDKVMACIHETAFPLDDTWQKHSPYVLLWPIKSFKKEDFQTCFKKMVGLQNNLTQ